MERAQQDFVLQTLAELPDPLTSGCVSDLDAEVVLREGYQNGSDMMEVTKAIGANLLAPKKVTQYGVHSLQRALPTLSKLGGKSREGFAYEMKVLNRRISVVVKTPQKASRHRDAMREYLLGVVALNPLRNVIPTMVYTLGAFVHEKKVYTIYEHIRGKSVRELLYREQINFEKWLAVYVQLLLTLEVAQRMASFTHFDLHADNVLVRETAGYVVPIDNDTYTVQPGLSPVIIDFGHTCAKVGDWCVGSHEHPNHGMVSFTVPGNDMYKFLVSSLHAARGGTQRRIAKLFQFYGGSDPYDIVSDMAHMTNATSQFCREVTFNAVASCTPKEFLWWILEKNNVRGVSRQTRKILLPVQIPKLACAKRLYRALAIAQQCITGGCVIPMLYASVLRQYSAEHGTAHVKTVLEALDNAELNPALDRQTLAGVFDVKVPVRIPIEVLDVPIRASLEDKRVDVSEIKEYDEEMSPYLRMYYTIVELKIPSLKEWVVAFRKSPQFRFYTENVTLMSRVLRWSKVLHLSSAKNRF